MSQAHTLGDLEQLWENDSKYRRLVTVLTNYFDNHPDEKIVLFACATLRYLHERLASEGIQAVVLMGGGDIDKQGVIDAFSQSSTSRVLLSSEVASEGIDLQFCRVLVNYDLPWNPMKVEQRIGRLDRLGQEAQKITIWNLIYEGTIDERIYDQLYERLEIFKTALGGLESVLGDEIRKLTMDLLRGELTSEQEEERIKQTAQAIVNVRAEEERLEDEAGTLVAHADYILNEIRASRELNRWITEEDLWNYVHDFVNDHYPGCEMRQVSNEQLLFEIRLSNDARVDLDDFLKRHRLHPLTRLAAAQARPIPCLFENKVAGNDKTRHETISQFHPLARFVSERIRDEDVGYHPAVSVEVSHTVVPQIATDTYVFSIQQWSIQGIRDIEWLEYVVKPLSGTPGFLDRDRAEQLVTTAARRGKDWHGARTTMDLDMVVQVVEACLDESVDRYEEYIRNLENENNDRADLQVQTLHRHRERQLDIRQKMLRRHQILGRARLVRAVEGQIAALQSRVDLKLTEIARRRELRSHSWDVCVGLMTVS